MCENKSKSNMTLILIRKTVVLFVSILTLKTAHAQDAKKDGEKETEAKVQSIINSKDFVFIAESASPMGGRTIYLTSVYSVRVSKDTLVADLPYYGRAYSAPMNPSEGGLKLTSTDFELSIQSKKKDGWNILITPKNARDVRQLFLNASENGYASMQVTSNNRQAISFTGYIKERKK